MNTNKKNKLQIVQLNVIRQLVVGAEHDGGNSKELLGSYAVIKTWCDQEIKKNLRRCSSGHKWPDRSKIKKKKRETGTLRNNGQPR